MRDKHIEFIENDTKSKDEEIISDISFMGAIYMLQVQKKSTMKKRMVTYSAAANTMKGYRKISIEENNIQQNIVLNENNSIKINEKQIANFSIKKLAENSFEIDNGRIKSVITPPKNTLTSFQNEAIQYGAYLFFGNKKEFSLIMDSLVKSPNPTMEFKQTTNKK